MAKPNKQEQLPATEDKKLPAVKQMDITDDMYSADAGHGMEQADSASFAIPFLSIIQKMSPICDEASGDFDPEAKPGQLMNTVTKKRHDGKVGVVILPAHYQRRFLRWGPKGTGGFKGEMMPEDAAELEASGAVINVDGRLLFPTQDGLLDDKKCDRLADVRNHFCFLEDDEMNVLMSLGSTQIKKSKMLMSLLSNVKITTTNGRMTPPTWANRVRAQTVLEQNDQGSWYGWKFTLEGLCTKRDDYEQAKMFYQMLKVGKAGEVRYQEDVAQAAAGDGENF